MYTNKPVHTGWGRGGCVLTLIMVIVVVGITIAPFIYEIYHGLFNFTTIMGL